MLYACGPNAVEEGTFTRVNEPALEIVGPSVEIICGAMLPPSCERHLEGLELSCPAELAWRFEGPNAEIVVVGSFERQGTWGLPEASRRPRGAENLCCMNLMGR